MTLIEIAKLYNLPDNTISEYTSANYKAVPWHRGHLLVTEELLISGSGEKAIKSIWPIFVERIRVPKENGIIKIEGWSYMFEECNEAESYQYDAIFTSECGWFCF